MSEALPATSAPFIEPCAGPPLRSEAAGASRAAELVEALRRAKSTPPAAAGEIVETLRAWRYAPYKLDGVVHAACFAVAFRVK